MILGRPDPEEWDSAAHVPRVRGAPTRLRG